MTFTIFADDRDQLDSLAKLRRPSVKSDSSSRTSNNPKPTLQAWAPLDSRNGKLTSSAPSPSTGRPTSANAGTAESDTGQEDGELASTGTTDMDITMNSSKHEADTTEIRKDVSGGAESMAIEETEHGNVPSPEGSSKMSVPAGDLSDEGEIRQEDVDMGEATGHITRGSAVTAACFSGNQCSRTSHIQGCTPQRECRDLWKATCRIGSIGGY